MTYKVDRKKWARLTIFEQMGNIYSEVGRSFKEKHEGKEIKENTALVRALDLFDATVMYLIKSKSHRSKEVLRAKEEYLRLLVDKSVPREEEEKLENYFFQFALAARLDR